MGVTDPEEPDKVNVTKFIRGAQALPTFQSAIDSLLNTAEKGE